MTSSLANKIRIKDNLCLLAKKGRINKQVYKDFRNLLNKQLKLAKTLYHKNKFENCNGNIKKTWDIINKSIKNRKSTSKIMLADNLIPINEPAVPNTFVNHFANITQRLGAGAANRNSNFNKYLLNRQLNTFYLSQITPNEMRMQFLN